MRSARPILLLLVALLGASLAWPLVASAAEGHAARYVALDLAPGRGQSLVVDGRELLVSIPDSPDESASIGTFRVTSAEFDSGFVPRNGGIEGAWVEDLDSDGRDEVLFVVRSAGSGSYVELILVACSDRGIDVQQLPQPDPALTAGAMGHDLVAVEAGNLIRTAPTYETSPGLRIDRQWRPADALDGRTPIKSTADSNASPSGRDICLVYDLGLGRWRRAD